MKPVQQIKLLLPGLSSKDLKQVEMLAQQYRMLGGFKNPKTEDNLFYTAVARTISTKLKIGYPIYDVFIKQQPDNFKKLREVVLELDEWIEIHFPKVQRAKKYKLYVLFTEIVVEYIEEGPVPLSLPSTLNTFSKLPSLVDKKFPGYLQSNLFYMLLTSDNFKNDDDDVIEELNEI